MAAGGQAGDLQGASDRGSAAAVAGRVQTEVQTVAGPWAGAHGAVRAPSSLSRSVEGTVFPPIKHWREIV